MVKLLWFLKSKPGFTHEEFREYYQRSHVKMAPEICRPSHACVSWKLSDRGWVNPTHIREDGTVESVEPEWDCITEMRLKDEGAFQMVAKSTHAKLMQDFVDDEKQFLDREKCLMFRCEEVNTGTTPGKGAGIPQ